MMKPMYKYLLLGMMILVGILGVSSIVLPEAFAHRSGCHRWHSCPSDTGSYVCGDTGYCSECPDNNYCKSGQPILSTSASYPSLGSNTDLSSNIANPSNSQAQSVSTGPAQVSGSIIPQWIKNNAKWWSEGQTGDGDFVYGIQYLVQNDIIQIPQTQSSPNSGSQQIPKWIRNTAGWWADGQVDDSEFLKGIQYLVQAGIIQVNTSQQENQIENVTTQSDQTSQSSNMIPTSCVALDDGILPDPNCTLGAADANVTQDNIDSTICVSGYSSSVRPPVSYTEPLKFKLMAAYGDADSASNYELDHLIPLEIGGSPTDVRNLWPEPHYTTPNSYDKDRFENYLHHQVCSGSIDLKTAQNEIASNWLKYWEDAGRP